MTDLAEQLTALARAWDGDAPRITLDEVLVRAMPPVVATAPRTAAPDVPLAVVGDPRPRSRRHWTTLLVATAAAVAFLVVLFAIVVRTGDPARPGIVTTVTNPNTSETLSSTTTSVDRSPTTAPQSAAIVSGTTAEMSEIETSVAESLASIESFEATATSHYQTTSATGEITNPYDTVNDVILTANGSLWATGTPVEWSSYDPIAGIARSTSAAAASHYLQYNGWATLPVALVIGLDPIPRFDAVAAGATVEATSVDGRPAWSIKPPQGKSSLDGAEAPSQETFVVDKATGLVVRYSRITTGASSTSSQEATLTNVRVGAQLPPEFPGVFPADAAVDSSGNPSSFQLLTPAQAATQFGDGFVAPSSDFHASRIYVQNVPSIGATGSGAVVGPGPSSTEVVMEFPTGLALVSVSVSKVELPTDGGFCRSNDGKTCVGAAGPSVVTGGVLAGVPSELANGKLTIHSGTVTIVIRAVSDGRALELANSLEVVAAT